MTHPLDRRVAVEFIGMFLFVFTVDTVTGKLGGGTLAPLAIGSMLMIIVYAGGHISGGHYNPAVSIGVFVRGKLPARDLMAYWVGQVIAALLGGLAARVVSGHESQAAVVGDGRMLIAEFLFTFALVWVVLHTATAKATEGNSFYGLAIGFTVVAGAFAVGGISGAAFNPAIAIGAMVSGLLSWSSLWVYVVADLIGGVVAAIAFLYVLPEERVTREVPEERISTDFPVADAH